MNETASKRFSPNLKKVAIVTIVTGGAQLLVVFALIFTGAANVSGYAYTIVTCCALLGAISSMQAGWGYLKALETTNSALRIVGDLERFNLLLRAQRHDFKNHIQVVSALIDMQEYAEAKEYMLKVSSDMTKVNRANKTFHPAINALLQAKLAMCERLGIEFIMEITTGLEDLPTEPWQVCRVLGNILDNAVDALAGEEIVKPFVKVSISEDPSGYLLSITNNGPTIDLGDSVFLPGFSTKGEGRGMGLSIVRDIVEECGGVVTLASSQQQTRFDVFLPLLRKAPKPGPGNDSRLG